jgi:hypothetical protein
MHIAEGRDYAGNSFAEKVLAVIVVCEVCMFIMITHALSLICHTVLPSSLVRAMHSSWMSVLCNGV